MGGAGVSRDPETFTNREKGARPGADPLIWSAALPGVFVLLWTTGFTGTRLGLPYVEPATFLALRFGLAALFMVLLSLALRAPWPRARGAWRTAVTGLLMHGAYLGFAYFAMARMPVALVALIASLQPLLTATLVGRFLGERVTRRMWLGFLLGFAGVALVILRELDPLAVQAEFEGLVFSAMGLVAITLGTLWQKKHGQAMDMRTGQAIQLGAAAIAVALVALLIEDNHVDWTWTFAGSLTWLTLGMSVGTFSLLYHLIRRGSAARVASLFYLVPGVTAVEAYFLFGDRLSMIAVLGMALAALGVALVNRPGVNRPARGDRERERGNR